MQRELESAIVSLLSYAQDNFEFYCKEKFPKSVFHSRTTDTDYFGYLDHGDGYATVWGRGTGGKTKDQVRVSWGRNAMASDSDGDNEHDGFEMSAQSFLHYFGKGLLNFDSLHFCGHSAAASFLPIVAHDIGKLNSKLHIMGTTFCAAPPGNAAFKKEFDKLVPDWKHYEMKGDLIRTRFMRNPKSEILDGADVGECVELPPCTILQSIPLVRISAHRPRRVAKSLGIKFPQLKGEFEWIRKRCVN
jgi:hypothetical protein